MKNFVSLLLSSLLVLNLSIHSQTLQPKFEWSKTFGDLKNDEGWAIDKTLDGGYILAGYTIPSLKNWSDIYLIKTDSDGELIWSKSIGDSLDEYASDVKQLSDGSFIVAGYGRYSSNNYYDGLLLKIDQSGNVLWIKNFSNNSSTTLTSIDILDDGIILVGSRNNSQGNDEVYLVKTDFDGNLIWSKTFNYGNFLQGFCLKQTVDKGFIISGTNFSSEYLYNIFILRTDKDGNFLWRKSFGGAGNEQAFSILQLKTTKEFYLTGYTFSYGNGYSDIFVMKLSETGDSIWFKTFGNFGSDYGEKIKLSADYNLLISGYSRVSDINQNDLVLLKVDLAGNQIWSVNAGGVFEDRGYDFVQSNDNGYVVLGTTKTNGITNDVFLVKFKNEYSIDPPEMFLISDFPDDNGKKVFVKWIASENDGNQNNPVVKYSIWRKDDDVWTFIGEVPARQQNIYSFVAPTVYDSTIINGIFWSVFQVTAHGINSNIFASSLPDSGYSIDNLIPHTPDSLKAIIFPNYVKLEWSDPVDEDFQYFSIYRDTIPNFDLTNKQPIANRVISNFEDHQVELRKTYYYKIIAIDFSGNKSTPSEEIVVNLTGVEGKVNPPNKFFLYQNYPNPFNSSTNISFDIPRRTFVNLNVYDPQGRRISTIISGELAAGKYTFNFDAQNLPSGIYFYKLESEKFISIKKMILLK